MGAGVASEVVVGVAGIGVPNLAIALLMPLQIPDEDDAVAGSLLMIGGTPQNPKLFIVLLFLFKNQYSNQAQTTN